MSSPPRCDDNGDVDSDGLDRLRDVSIKARFVTGSRPGRKQYLSRTREAGPAGPSVPSSTSSVGNAATATGSVEASDSPDGYRRDHGRRLRHEYKDGYGQGTSSELDSSKQQVSRKTLR